MSVLGYRNESSIKSNGKTDEGTKTNMVGSLMAVIENKKYKKQWPEQPKMTEMRSLDCLQIPKRNLF